MMIDRFLDYSMMVLVTLFMATVLGCIGFGLISMTVIGLQFLLFGALGPQVMFWCMYAGGFIGAMVGIITTVESFIGDK